MNNHLFSHVAMLKKKHSNTQFEIYSNLSPDIPTVNNNENPFSQFKQFIFWNLFLKLLRQKH